MAAHTEPAEPTFDIGDRLEKSRRWCGIKSASRMAELLNERLGARLSKPISAGAVSAWEAGTNQPTRAIRLDELVRVWVDICNEAGADDGRATSVEFVYGLRTGSFSPALVALASHFGELQLLDDDLMPFDFYRRAELELVGR